MRLFIALMLMVASVTVARAQSTVTQNLSVKKSQPKFSGNLSLGYNSNFARQTDSESQQSFSGDFVGNYRLEGTNMLRLYMGGQKELTQGQEWLPSDGYAGWVNNAFWSRSSKLTVGQQVRVHIPMSKDSRDAAQKYTGVSVVPVFMVTMTPAVLFIYQPNFSKNFNKYQENESGNKLTEYSISQTAMLSWSINDNIYFQPTFVYRNSWSYGGQQRDPSYAFAAEAGYSISQAFTVAAGWTNEEQIRRLDVGPDTEFKAFDNNTSTFYTALYWVF